MTDSRRIITLLTDFGLRDHFVPVMKGVLLNLNPDLTLIDLSHTVPPQDIHSGAFTLGQAYSYFPPGTIHLAVVDPGVGTARKALAVSAGAHFFIAPDNGILTYVLKEQQDYEAYEITADHYFRKPVSSTFHGRDVFAPVAAWISRDIPLSRFGTRLPNPIMLKIPTPKKVQDNLIQGHILAVDHFGNLITNLVPEDLPAYDTAYTGSCKILAGKQEIANFRRTYGEAKPEEVFVLPGSSGYLEIAVKGRSAAALLGMRSGAPIGVILSEK
jgi:S-adenosylmethionine hydrolase